jgi:cytidine deaminase
MDYKKLVKYALKARKNSYSPYSGFRVGAALLTRSGAIVTGCNIENSSYGLTICAERTALFKALSDGYSAFTAIAIASDEDGFTPPCGACRQVLIELAGDVDVVMARPDGTFRIEPLDRLIPNAFTGTNLRRRGK